MRTTLNIDEALLNKARQCTGVTEKTRLLHLGLEALLQRKAAQELIALGGTDAEAKTGRRHREPLHK